MLGAGLAVALPPLVLGLLPAADEAARLQHLIVGYALAGLPFLWVARRWRDLRGGPAGRRDLVLAALVVRLALLALPPLLSEDVWRYVWDGAVQGAGLNPYAHAPGAAALDGLATDPALAAVRARVGHPGIATIYPPAAQITFGIAGLAGPSPLVLRVLFVLAEGVSVAALWRWAERAGADPRCAALYAFAPVPVLESAVGAHVDALGVAGMLVAGASLAGGRPWRAGAALAVAIGTKLFPVVAIPTLLRRSPRAAVAAAAATALLALPYALTGRWIPPGLGAFAHRWRANDGLFALVHWPFARWAEGLKPPLELAPWTERAVRLLVGGERPGADVWPDELAFAAAKAVTLALFGVVIVHRLVKALDLEGFLGPVTAALLLLSPVVHPWYLPWLLPFCALAAGRGSAWAWPLVAWGLLAWIAYLPRPEYLRLGTWSEAATWSAVQYLPVWFGLALAAWRRLQLPAPRRPGGATPA